jgi:hypothetical protein
MRWRIIGSEFYLSIVGCQRFARRSGIFPQSPAFCLQSIAMGAAKLKPQVFLCQCPGVANDTKPHCRLWVARCSIHERVGGIVRPYPGTFGAISAPSFLETEKCRLSGTYQPRPNDRFGGAEQSIKAVSIYLEGRVGRGP